MDSSKIQDVHVGVHEVQRFAGVLGDVYVTDFLARADQIRELLGGRTVWNVNSTAAGGGVAEMLQSLLAYTRGLGIDTRWVVISGTPEFYKITKRLHHAIHGQRGDGSPLGDAERAVYEEVLRDNAAELCPRVQPGDIVLLHDPQPAGMAQALMARGAIVLWRCHIGEDTPSAESKRAWDFLRPYLEEVPSLVFSRQAYVPSWCIPERVTIVPPSIDAFSPKNLELDDGFVRSTLVHTGLVAGPIPQRQSFRFIRTDGTPGRVERRAEVVRSGEPPQWETPLIVQVSRWDPLKDMKGVMLGFARMLEQSPEQDAALLLAGPDVRSVADDPEAPEVFEETVTAWRALPDEIRERVHLVLLPMDDIEENAAIVNALQRHAAIVVQKSLKEGFGLTVTEAMWKARPMIASRVGGIQDQVEDGVHGILLDDPSDLDALAQAMRRLLDDPAARRRMGDAARQRVREEFLGTRHLLAYAALFEQLLAAEK